MKKVAVLVLALLLCLTMTVFADVPSKTTEDLTKVKVSAENLPEGSGFAIWLVEPEDRTELQETIYTTQLEELSAAESVEAYFDGAVDAEGNPADLKALLKIEEGEDAKLDVFEVHNVMAKEYLPEYGDVTAEFLFATPYEEGDDVAMMIGMVTVDAEGNQDVTWTALAGKVVDDQGSVEAVLPPELVTGIQEGNALLAVISK